MELKILVLSHGRFCEEIIKSAEMIVGENKNLYAIPLLIEDDQESFMMKIKKIITSFCDAPYLIIVDVMGGTPFNCAMKLLQDHSFSLVTGLCLAMLLEAYFLNVNTVEEAASLMLLASKEAGYLFDQHSLL